MSRKIGTFNMNEVTVSLGGAPITGFSPTDSVSISEDQDAFKDEPGIGQTDRIKHAANRLNITLNICQTAATNDVLSAIHSADRLSGQGVLPFLLVDKNGRTLVTAVECWIVKFPDLVLANEAKPRQWTLHTGGFYTLFIGGNS